MGTTAPSSVAGYSKVDKPDPWYKSVHFGAGTHRDGDDGPIESGVVLKRGGLF